jgi:hypothetical protein
MLLTERAYISSATTSPRLSLAKWTFTSFAATTPKVYTLSHYQVATLHNLTGPNMCIQLGSHGDIGHNPPTTTPHSVNNCASA